MFGRTLKLTSVKGIDIKVDASWLLIAALIVWSFWARFTTVDDYAGLAAGGLALVTALFFFLSILAHELAHALEAQRRGVSVGGITLFVFGGATETRFDVKRPIDEFALTAVGPFTSFVLAAVFGVIAVSADGTGAEVVSDIAGPLAWINGALGVFNLLPGAPLDGGRILRSAVWKVTDDRAKATRVAARSGQVLGGLLIAAGLAEFLLVEGAPIGGLWLAVIGWFLLQAARAELAQVEIEGLLGPRHAGDLVTRDPLSVDRSEPVEDVIDHYLRRMNATAVVVTEAGEPVGILGVDDVRDLSASERTSASAGEAMRPLAELPTVPADADAADVLDGLREAGVVVVRDNGTSTGIVTAERLQRFLERESSMVRAAGPSTAEERDRSQHG